MAQGYDEVIGVAAEIAFLGSLTDALLFLNTRDTHDRSMMDALRNKWWNIHKNEQENQAKRIASEVSKLFG